MSPQAVIVHAGMGIALISHTILARRIGDLGFVLPYILLVSVPSVLARMGAEAWTEPVFIGTHLLASSLDAFVALGVAPLAGAVIAVHSAYGELPFELLCTWPASSVSVRLSALQQNDNPRIDVHVNWALQMG